MSLFVPSGRHTSSGLPAVVGLLVLLCFLLMPQGLSAQVSTTGKIAGTVTDSSGAAVPNLAVSVKSSALLVPRTPRTERGATYLFDLLPPGPYELTPSPT